MFNLQLIDRKWRTIPSLYGLAIIGGIQAAALVLPKSVLDHALWPFTIGDWVQIATAVGVFFTAVARVLQKKEPTDDNGEQ